MNHRQFFVFFLALAYFSLSLALLSVPVWFSEYNADLLRLYSDFPPQPAFSGLLVLFLLLHTAIVLSLLITAFWKRKTGLIMLAIFGGFWLALQWTRPMELNFLRPIAELLIYFLCFLAFGFRHSKPDQRNNAQKSEQIDPLQNA